MLSVAAFPPSPARGTDSGSMIHRTTQRRRKGYAMQLDKKSIDRLLKLNDDQLRTVIGKLLTEYGVDVSRVPLATLDMSALRAVLQMAGEENIASLLQALGGGQSR